MSWIAPLVIAIAKENEEGLTNYFTDTMHDILFLTNFGWFDYETLCHMNIPIFHGYDMVFAMTILGAHGCTGAFNLLRSKVRLKETLDFNTWLPPTKDADGCQVKCCVCCHFCNMF